jgi:hypothetical protein
LLASAERFKEAAILFGSFRVNTPFLRSSAFEPSVTACDQRLVERFPEFVFAMPGLVECRPQGEHNGGGEGAHKDDFLPACAENDLAAARLLGRIWTFAVGWGGFGRSFSDHVYLLLS